MAELTVVCPKCGRHQHGGEECLHCGIVFARYHTAGRNSMSAIHAEACNAPQLSGPSILHHLYRKFRWVALASLVVVLVLILHRAPPPQIVTAPLGAECADAKVQRFLTAAQRGNAETLEMDEEELNAWLSANLESTRPAGASASSGEGSGASASSSAVRASMAPPVSGPLTEGQRSKTMHDIKIALRQNSLAAYALVEIWGMDLSLEVEGRLTVENGRMRIEPTRGRLGSLPLFAGLLESTTHSLFDSPENREKFRLPSFVRDISVQQGQLIVSSR